MLKTLSTGDYDSDNLLRVDFLGSGGLSALFDVKNETGYGTCFKPSRVFSNKYSDGINKANGLGFDTETILSGKYNFKQEPEDRDVYFDELLDVMNQNPSDVLALAGFMLLIPDSFLDKIKCPVINVHPANLSIMRYNSDYIFDAGMMKTADITKRVNSGKITRAFIGDNAVYDAVLAGQIETMSTIHVVNSKTDAGTIITRKALAKKVDQSSVELLKKQQNFSAIQTYSDYIQGRMKTECDGPAYGETFRIMAQTPITLNTKTETLYIDGVEQPYGGVLMNAL